MAGQITVNLDALESQEKELDDLLTRLSARKLKVNITVSKGAIVDGPQQTVNLLNDLSTNLVELVTRTRDAVRKTRIEFSKADQSVADYFNSTEE